MPSYAELEQEDAWVDEYEPPALLSLADGLEMFLPGAQCWIRGDNNHLRGYHRSRRWIKESAYCTNRTYSVSRTSGDVSGGDGDWACAIDLAGVDQPTLHAVCRRLDEACRAGRLEKITEWYGNLGGDDVVDGWDNISNRPASSGSSHLTHLHISFDRGRANENHSDVLNILIGDNVSDAYELLNNMVRQEGNHTFTPAGAEGERYGSISNALVVAAIQRAQIDARQAADDLVEVKALLQDLLAQPPGSVDAEMVRAVVRQELDKTGFREIF